MPGQTVQTQIKLLLDQSLHCLQFRLHRLDSLHYSRAHSSTFRVITTKFLGVRISRKFTVSYRQTRMDRIGVWRFPEGSRRQGKVERYCCNVICGAQITVKVKGMRDERQTMLASADRDKGKILSSKYFCIIGFQQ